MARPTKFRRVEFFPEDDFFVPCGKPKCEIEEIVLKVEELEAMRLKDIEELNQEECAEKMEVSRPTFQRILLSAREKVADSLINGKMIRIEGGNFTLNICPIQCKDCGKEWKDSFENLKAMKNGTYVCPDCGSGNVICEDRCLDKVCCKQCRRHRG